MANICTECGSRVEPDAAFCPECLATIVSAPASSAAPSSLAAHQPNEKRNPLLLIGAGVGIALAAGLGFGFASRDDVKAPETQQSSVAPSGATIVAQKAPESVTSANLPVPVSREAAELSPKQDVQQVNTPPAPKPKTVEATIAEAPAVNSVQICIVADPTGTPLNVRSGPKGPVLGQLSNGQKVSMIRSVQGLKGKWWAEITAGSGAFDGRSLRGWVFKDFLSCRE